MKLKLISISILTVIAQSAHSENDFVTLVIGDDIKYISSGVETVIEYTPWVFEREDNCVVDYTEEDYYYGKEFDQIETCDKIEKRTKTTIKKYDTGFEEIVKEEQEEQINGSLAKEPVAVVGKHLEANCKDALTFDNTLVTQRYTISLPNNGNVRVTCDMDTDGGGWTLIQYRNSFYDFKKTYSEYENGFGNSTNFWLGNKYINELTTDNTELYVNLIHHNGSNKYARYNSFNIGNASTKYTMKISGYSGTAGDSLSYHSDKKFTTYDQDNDLYETNCSDRFHGGWWYGACHSSNLNGYYFNGDSPYAEGLTWSAWTGQYYSFYRTKLMIR